MITRKGFTLLEISMVLVVIGILVAIVTKTVAYLDTAKIRHEISKINFLEQAVVNYEIKTGRSFTLNSSELLDAGVLTNSDLNSYIYNSKSYIFVACSVNSSKYLPSDEKNFAKFSGGFFDKGNNICISDSNKEFSERLICSYEGIADDKDSRSGKGRLVGDKDGVKQVMPLGYNKCSKASDDRFYDYFIMVQ